MVTRDLKIWCVDCGASMKKEEYDDKHDRYVCCGCEREIEVEKDE